MEHTAFDECAHDNAAQTFAIAHDRGKSLVAEIADKAHTLIYGSQLGEKGVDTLHAEVAPRCNDFANNAVMAVLYLFELRLVVVAAGGSDAGRLYQHVGHAP